MNVAQSQNLNSQAREARRLGEPSATMLLDMRQHEGLVRCTIVIARGVGVAPIHIDTERSRKRAVWLRQLAERAAHPHFAEKLEELTEEYNGFAEQLEHGGQYGTLARFSARSIFGTLQVQLTVLGAEPGEKYQTPPGTSCGRARATCCPMQIGQADPDGAPAISAASRASTRCATGSGLS